MCLLHLYKESVIVPINLLFLSQQVLDTSKLSLLFLPFFWGLLCTFNPFRGICLLWLWAKNVCVCVCVCNRQRSLFNLTQDRFCTRNIFLTAKARHSPLYYKYFSQSIWRPRYARPDRQLWNFSHYHWGIFFCIISIVLYYLFLNTSYMWFLMGKPAVHGEEWLLTLPRKNQILLTILWRS